MPTLTLDFLIENEYPAPNFVKIDVEGAEDLVFREAERLLSIAQPIVMCEVSSHSANFVSSVLLKHDYQLFDCEKDIENRFPVQCAPFNTLALPKRFWTEPSLSIGNEKGSPRQNLVLAQ